MDKSKSKDNLRAAGKKRLEEFRQKRQQKASSTKSSGSTLKAPAEEEKLLSDTSDSSTPHVKADEQDSNLSISLSSLGEVQEQRLDLLQERLLNEDESHSIVDEDLDCPAPQRDVTDGRTEIVDCGPEESFTQSGESETNISLEEANTRDGSDSALLSTVPVEARTGDSDSGSLKRELANEMKTTETKFAEVSSDSLSLQTSESDFVPIQGQEQLKLPEGVGEKIHQWEVQPKSPAVHEDADQIVIPFLSEAEQNPEVMNASKDLMAEIQSLQKQLRIVQQERVQLDDEHSKSHRELHSSNVQLTLELRASQEAVLEAKHHENLLLAELQQTKMEIVKDNSASDLERLQKQVADRDQEISELIRNLTISNKSLEQLEEEKSLLISETRQPGPEFHRLQQENARLLGELQASQSRLESVQEQQKQLSSEVESFLHERHEYVDRIDNCKIENTKQANQLLALREELQKMSEEHVQSVSKLEVALDECSKMVDCITEEKLKVTEELSVVKPLLLSTTEGKENLAAELQEAKVQLEVLQLSANNLESELKENQETLTELQGNHTNLASDLKKSELELSKFRKEWSLQELEIVAYREHVAKLEEQNSSLVKLLEETQKELLTVNDDRSQRTRNLEFELEQEKGVSQGLLLEKGSLVSELQEVQGQWKLLQQDMELSVREHRSELEKQEQRFRELGENHTKLSNELQICKDQLTKVQEEKTHAEGEHLAYMDQLRKVEALNKDLRQELDGVRQHLDGHIQEKATLLEGHGLEVRRFEEHVAALENVTTDANADIVNLLGHIDILKAEKGNACLEAETWKEQSRKLGEENASLTNDLMTCKDQMQLFESEGILLESKLRAEIASCRKQEEEIAEERTMLMKEIEVIREQKQKVIEQKENEIGVLQLQVEELLLSREHAVNELTTISAHAQEVETRRVELAVRVEQLHQQLDKSSIHMDSLTKDFDMSKQQFEELEKEKVLLRFELAKQSNRFQAEIVELQKALDISKEGQNVLSAEKDGLASELAMSELHLQEMQTEQARLVTEIETLVLRLESRDEEKAHLLVEFTHKDQQVQTLLEDKVQLMSELQATSARLLALNEENLRLSEDVQTSKHRVEMMELEITQLRTELRSPQAQQEFLQEDETKHSEDVRSRKDTQEIIISDLEGVPASTKLDLDQDTCPVLPPFGVNTSFLSTPDIEAVCQTGEIEESKEIVEGANKLLLGRLETLEEMVVTLKTERDFLAGKLEEVEMMLPSLSEKALEDRMVLEDQVSVLEAELLKTSILVSTFQENVSQSANDAESLIQKLEDTFCTAIPEGASELSSLRGNKSFLEYCSTLSGRLLFLISEIKLRLRDSEEKVNLSQKERDVALQAYDEIHSQLEKVVSGKEEYESFMKQLQAALIAEKEDLVNQIKELTQKYDDELAQETADKALVMAELYSLQRKISEQETAIILDRETISKIEGDIRRIVARVLEEPLFSEVAVPQEMFSLDCHPVSQLEACITVLIDKYHEPVVLIENVKEEDAMVPNKSEQALVPNSEEGDDRKNLMENSEEILESRDLDLSNIEGSKTTIAQQANEIKVLLLQTERLSQELDKANLERESLQAGLVQTEQKLSVVREKLSMAVNKGKAVVQQRDALKQTLALKASEVDTLKIAHEQELQLKDALLHTAEMKSNEYLASREHAEVLGRQVSSLEEVVKKADLVFQESEGLIVGLSTVVEVPQIPRDWHACELVEKIVYLTGASSKLLQMLMSAREEVQNLTESSTTLASMAEESQARAAMLDTELTSLKLEREEIISNVEEARNLLQLELQRKDEEKIELTSLIRQMDLDSLSLKLENENLTRNAEEHASNLANLEMEVASLLTKIAKQDEKSRHEVVSHQTILANIIFYIRNLVDIYAALPQFEARLDSDKTSLAWCRDLLLLLVDRYNLTVQKLDETVRQAATWTTVSEQALPDSVPQKLLNPVHLMCFPDDLVKKFEATFLTVGQQATNATALSEQIDRQAAEIMVANDAKYGLQLELSSTEQKLATVREKLSSAISKGKSLVQHRDAMKQVIAEKNAELDTLVAAHKEEVLAKEEILNESSQKLGAALDRVNSLEMELLSLKNSVTSEVDSSQVKVDELERLLSGMQLKVDLAEAEAERARKASSSVSSELEECLMRSDALAAQMSIFVQEKEELGLGLETFRAQHEQELQKFVNERAQLISNIGELESKVASQKEGKETLMTSFEELSQNYSTLVSQADESTTGMNKLHAEIASLRNNVAKLEQATQVEVTARQKFESDVEAVVAIMQETIQEPGIDRSPSGTEGWSANSISSSQLEALSHVFVKKYKTAVQEVERLSEQVVLISNMEQDSRDIGSTDQECLQELQQILESKDLELSEMGKRMEEAAANMAEQEDVVQGLFQQVHKLRDEIAKVTGQRDALQVELELSEQKSASTREKLSLAVKKGKGVVQQRDVIKQSLAEQEQLVAKYKEEMETKDSTLESTKNELLLCAEQVQALELELSSLKKLTSVLDQKLQDKNNTLQELETVLIISKTPADWQSRDLVEKVEWLVSAVADGQNKAILAGQDAEVVMATSMQLSAELRNAQSRIEAEKESHSILALKLEKTENELQWCQLQKVELESQLTGLRGAHQQVEILSEKILNLEALLHLKQEEVGKAENAVFAWAGRSEETEAYIQSSQVRISELEAQLESMARFQLQATELSEHVANLEEVIEQKQSALKAAELSRSKAVNKLTVTVNKFRELCQQSEGLLAELDRLQGSVEKKDAEIDHLREEIAKLTSQTQLLQEKHDSKNSLLLQLEEQLKNAVLVGNNLQLAPTLSITENLRELKATTMEEEDLSLTNVRLLKKRVELFTAQLQAWQADIGRKDTQLEGLKRELEEANVERAVLRANLQRERSQFEKFKVDFTSMHDPVSERESSKVGEIEEVQLGKRSMPPNLPAPHVRAARKPASVDVAIDMDSDASQLLEVSDEKGHGFKSLATASFMPQGTRMIADRIDRLCVAGGRILMRRPVARLVLTLYWLAIHIWMALLLAT